MKTITFKANQTIINAIEKLKIKQERETGVEPTTSTVIKIAIMKYLHDTTK